MGLAVRDDGSASCYGGKVEEVLKQAIYRLNCRNWPDETASIVQRWVESRRQQIADEEFEKRVQRAAEPRLRYAAKVDRNSKYSADLDTVKRIILEQEREKLKKAGG